MVKRRLIIWRRFTIYPAYLDIKKWILDIKKYWINGKMPPHNKAPFYYLFFISWYQEMNSWYQEILNKK